jgi:hypothetical protein
MFSINKRKIKNMPSSFTMLNDAWESSGVSAAAMPHPTERQNMMRAQAAGVPMAAPRMHPDMQNGPPVSMNPPTQRGGDYGGGGGGGGGGNGGGGGGGGGGMLPEEAKYLRGVIANLSHQLQYAQQQVQYLQATGASNADSDASKSGKCDVILYVLIGLFVVVSILLFLLQRRLIRCR